MIYLIKCKPALKLFSRPCVYYLYQVQYGTMWHAVFVVCTSTVVPLTLALHGVTKVLYSKHKTMAYINIHLYRNFYTSLVPEDFVFLLLLVSKINK